MSFAFLSTGRADAAARSPMARQAAAAGARFEMRDGWSVAVAYAGDAATLRKVGFADVSHLRKWEVTGELPGRARARAGAHGERRRPGCR